MTALHAFLLAAAASGAGIAICGFSRRIPDRRRAIVLVFLALAAILAASALTVFKPRPDCYHPRDVQAVWLDGAWRCITEEEAG